MVAPKRTKDQQQKKIMKIGIPLILATALLAVEQSSAFAQGWRGGSQPVTQPIPANPAAEQALNQALAGPDGEYAALAEYTAIVQKFGQVQPYATILQAEERHIAALKRHFEIRGLAIPENPFLGTVQAPDTLKQAADAGIIAEERNVAIYDQLLEQVKDQPDLVRVFTHLQYASKEHHLVAFTAAAANNGQLDPGTFTCGMGAGQGRGGPPPWAGGRGRGQGFGRGAGGGCGACSGACLLDGTGSGNQTQAGPGRGYRYGPARQTGAL